MHHIPRKENPAFFSFFFNLYSLLFSFPGEDITNLTRQFAIKLQSNSIPSSEVKYFSKPSHHPIIDNLLVSSHIYYLLLPISYCNSQKANLFPTFSSFPWDISVLFAIRMRLVMVTPWHKGWDINFSIVFLWELFH